MTRWPRIVRRGWPALGVALLLWGATAVLAAPGRAELDAGLAAVERAATRLAELDGRDAVPDTLHAGELPLSLEVGRVVERLERDAAAAGIGSITFDASRDEGPVADAAAAVIADPTLPSFDAGADDVAAAAPATRGVEALAVVRVRARIAAGFPALCRFLGRVEAGVPVARVRSLAVRAAVDGVTAEVELETYALPEADVGAAATR